MTQLKFTLILLGFFAFNQVQSQPSDLLDKANRTYSNEGYDQAATLYKTVYKKVKKIDEKAFVLFRIGTCYHNIHKYKEAQIYYKKSIVAKYYKQDPTVFLQLGQLMLAQGKYKEAIDQFVKYNENVKDQDVGDAAISMVERCVDAMKENQEVLQVSLMPEMSSEYYDYAPVISNSGNELIFTSSRPASEGNREDAITGEDFSDLYVMKRDKKGKWSNPKVMSIVNSPDHEGAACWGLETSTLFFTRCVENKEDRLGCEIFKALKTEEGFSEPILIPIREEGDDSSRVGHPFMLEENVLLFSANLPGGFGGKDLYQIEFDSQRDRWKTPVNLGPEINTLRDEMYPFVKDNELYFSSNGHLGFGGLDIFKAGLVGELSWSEPVNLEYPINSSSDDFSLVIELDADQGYFTSNRPGGKGMDDIYSFIIPEVILDLEITVYDAQTGDVIEAAVVEVNEAEAMMNFTSNSEGEVLVNEKSLKADKLYKIGIEKEGYFKLKDELSTAELYRSTHFLKEYFLEPIITDTLYTFPEVWYPKSSHELLISDEVNSKDSLDYLLELLNTNPSLVIELQSHTDTRGGDDMNQILSENRAKTCVDYLCNRGVSKDRLKYIGFGENTPVISDEQIESMKSMEEREAGHLKNRRTVFRVVSFSYLEPE